MHSDDFHVLCDTYEERFSLIVRNTTSSKSCKPLLPGTQEPSPPLSDASKAGKYAESLKSVLADLTFGLRVSLQRHKETIEQLKKRHRAQQELEEVQHKVAQAKEDSSGQKRRRMEGEESGSERRASGSSMDTAEAIAELKEAHLQELQKTRVEAIHR